MSASKEIEKMIDRNDFDVKECFDWVSGTVLPTGLEDSDFAETLAGSVRTEEGVFTIKAGKKEKCSGSLHWTWHTMHRSGDTLFMATVQNVSNHPVTISKLTFSAESVPLADRADAVMYQWHSWNLGVKRLCDGNFHSENLLHITSVKAGRTFLCGCLTMSRMKVSHQLQLGAGRQAYSISMDFGEYILPAGACFHSEMFYAARYPDPYQALEDWAQKVHDLYQPRFSRSPTVGWIGGWVPGNEGETAEHYSLRNLRAIRNRLKGFGVEYIWTSQENLKDNIPGNWLACNTKEFPNGLMHFCDEVKKLGFRPGFWVAPFWFYGEAEGMYEKNKEYLLKDKSGKIICDESIWGWKYEDDGSHPKAMEYIHSIYKYYHAIGARYFMLDFLQIRNDAVMYDQTQTPPQASYHILRKIREAAGEDTHLLTAVSSTPGFAGIINAARIGRDFGEYRSLENNGALTDWRTATNVLHDENYANEKYLIRNAAGSYFTHQKIYQADYNCLTVDKPYPVSYVQIETTVFGMGGSNSVMLGDNIADISEERLKYIKLVLPRTPYSAVPADLFDRVQPEDECRLMKLPIQTAWDDYMLVAAYNTDDHPYDLTLDFQKLGLTGNQIIYDFWNEEYRGVFRDSFPVHLPANSCKLFRLTRHRAYPWLIGTDMHIQQGAVDIEDLQWDEETMTLTGCAVRPAGETGTITILMPRNYKLKNCTREIHLLKELEDYRILLMLPLHFGEDGKAPFHLEFEHWDFHNLSPRGHIPYSNMEELKAYMAEHYTREDTRIFD